MSDAHREMKEPTPLVLVATRDLIQSHCPDCLESIAQEADKAVITTKSTTAAKYAIRDDYIGAVLKIPFENVSGKFYFYIKIEDLLKNDAIKEKMQALMAAAPLDSRVDFTSRPLEVNEKIQIAAFLNLFVTPHDRRNWKANAQMVYFQGPSTRYQRREGVPISKELKESLTLPDMAIAIGFSPEMLQKLREKIEDEDHSRAHYFKIKDDSVLMPFLKIIRTMELESKLHVLPGLIDDVTFQMAMVVSTYQQKGMKELAEALPKFSMDLVNLVGSYTAFFKSEKKVSGAPEPDVDAHLSKQKRGGPS